MNREQGHLSGKESKRAALCVCFCFISLSPFLQPYVPIVHLFTKICLLFLSAVRLFVQYKRMCEQTVSLLYRTQIYWDCMVVGAFDVFTMACACSTTAILSVSALVFSQRLRDCDSYPLKRWFKLRHWFSIAKIRNWHSNYRVSEFPSTEFVWFSRVCVKNSSIYKHFAGFACITTNAVGFPHFVHSSLCFVRNRSVHHREFRGNCVLLAKINKEYRYIITYMLWWLYSVWKFNWDTNRWRRRKADESTGLIA